MTAACGSDPEPEPQQSDRPANPRAQWVTLEDVLIVPGSCTGQGGDTANLTFTVTNNRIEESDALTSISTPGTASVELMPRNNPIKLAPFGSTTVDLPNAEPRPFVTAEVRGLSGPQAMPGEFVNVTFHFEEAGAIVVRTPIEPCSSPNA